MLARSLVSRRATGLPWGSPATRILRNEHRTFVTSQNVNVRIKGELRLTEPARRCPTTLHAPRNLVRSEAQRNTIYALSTPPGKAGVAVIRVSGPEALQVWRGFVVLHAKSPKGKDKELLPEPWKMHRCDVVHPQTQELLDSGLAVFFKGKSHLLVRFILFMYSLGPKSFTGEDVLELHIHSGRAIVASVLDALGSQPQLRLAEPGEFTRRAFEVGRLDLTEVEGLHDLINAETASQRKAALQAVGVRLCVQYLRR